jgi:hypothetical protein
VALNAPQKIHLKKEKRVTIKIPNKTEAEIIKYQAKEKIVARIQQCAGEKDASYTILAVRQLKSGNIVVYINSTAGKKEIKTEKLDRGNLPKRRSTKTNLAGHRIRCKDKKLPA